MDSTVKKRPLKNVQFCSRPRQGLDKRGRFSKVLKKDWRDAEVF